MVGQGVLAVAEFAERMQMNRETVRVWLRQGKLKGVRPGGTKLGYRIPESELARLLGTPTDSKEEQA